MKIYNEIILQWNDDLNQFETLFEDSYDHYGEIYKLSDTDQPKQLFCQNDSDCSGYAEHLETIGETSYMGYSYCNTDMVQEEGSGLCQYCYHTIAYSDDAALLFCQCSATNITSIGQYGGSFNTVELAAWFARENVITVGNPYIINEMFDNEEMCQTDDGDFDWLNLDCIPFKYEDIIGSGKYVIHYNEATW